MTPTHPMTMNNTTARILVPFLLFLCAGSPLAGQEMIVDLDAMSEVDDAPSLPDAEQQSGGKQGSALAQALARLKIKRLPAAILAAQGRIANGLVGKGDQPEAVAKRYLTLVMAGDWPGAAAIIAGLPAPNERDAAFDALINAFDQDSLLLPADLSALIGASPVELTDQRLALLGTRLAQALANVRGDQELLTALDRGVGPCGGATPAGRLRAAKLLLAADKPAAALRFLPPLGDPASSDLDAMELRVRVLSALSAPTVPAAPTGASDAPTALAEAWTLSGGLIDRLQVADEAQRERWLRCIRLRLELGQRMPAEERTAWMREMFLRQPALGRMALATAGEKLQPPTRPYDGNERQEALTLCHGLVTGLLEVVAGDTAPWHQAIEVMALAWEHEARSAWQNPMADNLLRQEMIQGLPPMQQQVMQQHAYQYSNQFQFRNQARPIEPALLAKTVPGPAWLACLDASLARSIRILGAVMAVRSEGQEGLEQVLTLAAADTAQAQELVGEACGELKKRRAIHDEIQQQLQQQMQRYQQYNNPMTSDFNAIPLTRARQVRDLKHLGDFLARAKALGVTLPPAQQAHSFADCHSPAEVFRREDIVAVLGEPATLPAEILTALVDVMRERLASAWRSADVQQQAQTKRSDPQITAEVTRGYALASELIGIARTAKPDDWGLLTAIGTLRFDQGEFSYGQKAPLEVYVGLRDDAFATFAAAAARYAAWIGVQGGARDATAVTYLQWFQSALGASDLAYLTRQQEANVDQIAKVGAALRSLPAAEAERHLRLFCEGIDERLPQVPAHLKMRYVRHTMRVIGDHARGAALHKLLASYDDLLGEVALDLSLDGSTSVGDQPFGVRVALRHSDAVGRECGGFDTLLRNQVSGRQGRPANHRDDLEKHLRDGLAERFEVMAVQFHKPEEEVRPFGREGWHEKPLAYLLLRAKDYAADRIPSVQVDLEFTDSVGPVVLPVPSAVTVIDAKPGSAVARPCHAPEAVLVLDAREADGGRVVLELQVRAKGLVGTVDTIYDLAVPGFETVACDDQGLILAGLDTDGAQVEPVSERRARVTYRGVGSPSAFRFPLPRAVMVRQIRKQYQDADVVEAGEVAALMASARTTTSAILLAGLGLALAGLAGGWWWRRRHAHAVAVEPRYQRPERLTPFTVLALLKRIRNDDTVALDVARRAELDTILVDLDRRFFAPGVDGEAPPDLAALAERWVAEAHRRQGTLR